MFLAAFVTIAIKEDDYWREEKYRYEYKKERRKIMNEFFLYDDIKSVRE